MHVVTHARIVEAQKRHPAQAKALDVWYRIMKRARFMNFSALRQAFGSVDKVGLLYVFDISGNTLRLIAAIHFNTGKVFVRHVLTHTAYDTGAWKHGRGTQ